MLQRDVAESVSGQRYQTGDVGSPAVQAPDDLRKRTKAFAPSEIGLVALLPRNPAADVLGRQLLRSATSVAANYRAARRARSTAEFISKLGVVEEEADESLFWLEMLIERDLTPAVHAQPLLHEASQLVAIIVTSRKRAKRVKE